MPKRAPAYLLPAHYVAVDGSPIGGGSDEATMSRVIEDKHRRIQFAALCLVSSVIGYAALYAAGFSRFGSGRFIALAIFLLVIAEGWKVL